MDDLNGQPGPRTSPEKIEALFDYAANAKPDDEETAQLLALFNMIGPVVAPMIPSDPERLDQLLSQGARLFLELRSDNTPAPDWLRAVVVQTTGE